VVSPTAPPAIVVDDVSKRFRLYTDKPTSLKGALTRLRRSRFEDFWALRDVSLDVSAGESFGLIGHNGSGKSTLLRLMARIHQPTSGKVRTRGRVSALLELGAGFHPELSGRENVYLNGAILGIDRRDVDRMFDDIVDFSGLSEFIDSPVKVYSSGMYVRLGFAVAVHVDPEILMIDEVIAVGDEEFQRRCSEHLYTLRRDGVTIVLVSHALGSMQNMCDRLAWLDHGRLMAVGDPQDVVRAYRSRVDDDEEHRLGDGHPVEPAGPEGAGRRVGTREIAITDFEVLGPDGEPVSMPASGSPVTFRVHYDARTPIDNPRFDIGFETGNGVWLTGRGTADDRVVTGRLEGEGYIDCVVDELPFSPGALMISVGVTDEHQLHAYDYFFQGYELHVRESDEPEHGHVRLGGRWTSPVPGSRRLAG
jgi:ABC-type polysaccharide/polyol phosphate transport system ATPase subunit